MSIQRLQEILLFRARLQKAFNGSLPRSLAHFLANFRAVGSWNTRAGDTSTKPVFKENIQQESKLEPPASPMQKQFRSRPDAPIFVPSKSNGSTNMPQVKSPVFSIPTRGRGGSVRISAPSLSLDVAFKPLIVHADEDLLIELNEPDGVNRHKANTSSSGVESSENVGNLSGQGINIQNKDKPATEEDCGALISVTESEMNSSQRQTLSAEKPVTTDKFFSSLKENSKPPHRRAVENSHPVTSKRYVPTDIDAEATALHGLNLVVIKDFARRAEALRQGDINAIPSTGGEEEEGYKSLPAVSQRTRSMFIPQCFSFPVTSEGVCRS